MGWESWPTSRQLGHGTESGGIAGGPHICSEWVGTGREAVSTSRQLGQGTASAGIAGRMHSSWDPGSRRPGQLVDPQHLGPGTDLPGIDGGPASLRTWDESAGKAAQHDVPQTQDRVGWDSWSITRQLGPGTESAGMACRPHSSSEPGPNRRGQLINPESAWTQD